MAKVKYKTIKSRKNHKIEKYQINQEVRISSFIIQPLKEKNYANYKKPDIVSKSQAIEDWKVKAKIIQEMRNYEKVKIISKQPRHHLLQKDSIWSRKQRCYKQFYVKFECYFTVNCELKSRVGGWILWVNKFF